MSQPDLEITDNEKIQEFPARRGYSVSYLGKTLLSKIDPVNQAERLVKLLPVQERTLYLCPSPLYGYGLDTLLEKLGKDSAVLCVEVSGPLFELSLRHMAAVLRKGNEKNNRLRLIRAEPESAASVCAFVDKTWGRRHFRRVELLNLTGGAGLFPDFYGGLLSALQRDMAISWGNAITLIKLGRLYSRNLIKNLPLLARFPNVSALNYGENPVLVLGAGPSLDGILADLESRWGRRVREPAERNFRIICADTCILPLKDRGIKPDLVVILESQHWNLRDFSGAAGWEVPSALDLSALPASGRVLGGGAFLFMTPWTELRLFSRLAETSLAPPALNPLGSVGLSAVNLAAALTKGPVVAAGIDFSFTLDAYHARSTPGHRTNQLRQNRFNPLLNVKPALREGTFTLKSKSGLTVRSDPAMRGYRRLFEEEFGPNKRIFEIESSGLWLGRKILSRGEALEKLAAGTAGAIAANKTFSLKKEEKETREKKLFSFIDEEEKKLLHLKEFLSGVSAEASQQHTGAFEKTLDQCDYLWVHFPECAGAGGKRPDITDISFLKRLRTEIDPFLKLWAMARKELADSSVKDLHWLKEENYETF